MWSEKALAAILEVLYEDPAAQLLHMCPGPSKRVTFLGECFLKSQMSKDFLLSY